LLAANQSRQPGSWTPGRPYAGAGTFLELRRSLVSVTLLVIVEDCDRLRLGLDLDDVADMQLAVGEDVSAETAAVQERLDRYTGQLLKVAARFAEAHAAAVELADPEPSTYELVEPDAACHDVSARIGARETDGLQHLCLNQC
jgi:hypothetical protein